MFGEDYWLTKYLLTATAEGDSLLSLAGGKGEGEGEGNGEGEGGGGKGEGSGEGGGETVEIKVPKGDLEGIPENFLKDGSFSPSSLVKSWKDQQVQIKDLSAKIKPAVEKPDAYELKIPDDNEELKGFAAKVLRPDEKLGEDPLVHDFRDVAHKFNLPQDAFQGILEWYISRQGPQIPEPIDQKAEMEKLGPDAQKAIDYVDKARETLKANGTLDEGMANEMWLTTSSAAGIKLVMALLQQGGGLKLPTDLTPEDKAASADKMQQRIRELMEKRDKGEISEDAANREFARIREDYKDVVGEEQGGTSLILGS